MSTQIVIVADQMFPVAALPDAPLPADDASLASPFIARQATRETRFNLRPAIGIVGIIGRQTPYAMQMIRQHHNRQYLERTNRLRRPERGTQIVHALHEQPAAALQQIDGEEIGATGHMDATIVRHVPSFAPTPVGRHRKTPSIRVRKTLGLVESGIAPASTSAGVAGVGRAQARLTGPASRILQPRRIPHLARFDIGGPRARPTKNTFLLSRRAGSSPPYEFLLLLLRLLGCPFLSWPSRCISLFFRFCLCYRSTLTSTRGKFILRILL